MLPVALALTLVLGAADWEKVLDDEGVEVYGRDVEGLPYPELKAFGVVEAPPERLLAVLADVESFHETRPYCVESRLIERKGDEILYYLRLDTPLMSQRDYVMRLALSRLPDGRLRAEFRSTSSSKAPPREGVVRLTSVEGSWLLTPLDGGTRTKLVYVVRTDPKVSLPEFVVNKVSAEAVPKLYAAIRKAASSPRYANARSPLAADAEQEAK